LSGQGGGEKGPGRGDDGSLHHGGLLGLSAAKMRKDDDVRALEQ